MEKKQPKGWDDSFMYTHVDPDLLQERVALTSLGLGFARSRVHNSKDRAKRIERLKDQFDNDYLTPSAAYGQTEELHPERRAARHRNAARQSGGASVDDGGPWKPKSSFEKKLERSNNLVRTTQSNIRGMHDAERDPYVMGIQSRLRIARK
ncbi:Hypp7517 [Branchiostoma lanceolatum]|uniref:Hypp7517 protein n=1 Tax=Branchiostoma lanceolatum TaxID=7740 RepID=A0A8J9Z1T4_BRALA|nr:Hypp7517 [Branchiostoma lanceolatum]